MVVQIVTLQPKVFSYFNSISTPQQNLPRPSPLTFLILFEMQLHVVNIEIQALSSLLEITAATTSSSSTTPTRDEREDFLS